jgi:hypothetical protein
MVPLVSFAKSSLQFLLAALESSGGLPSPILIDGSLTSAVLAGYEDCYFYN